MGVQFLLGIEHCEDHKLDVVVGRPRIRPGTRSRCPDSTPPRRRWTVDMGEPDAVGLGVDEEVTGANNVIAMDNAKRLLR